MQRSFFATADDILPVLERVESRRSLRYALTGLFPTQSIESVTQGVAIPSLRSPASRPNAIDSPTYLVTSVDLIPCVRPIPQTTGGLLYAVDQLTNPDSISISFGGFWSPIVLLSGRIGTASDSSESTKLHRAFANAIAAHFSKIKAYWVGPEAERHLRGGCRLTNGANSPTEFDLSL
jgi:hypothetical protein